MFYAQSTSTLYPGDGNRRDDGGNGRVDIGNGYAITVRWIHVDRGNGEMMTVEMDT